MPSFRTVLLATALLAVAVVGVGAATVAPAPATETETSAAATNTTNLTVEGTARTSAPGMVSTHYYTIEIPNATDGEPLHSLRLDYSGTDADLGAGLTHYRTSILRAASGENRTRIRLANVSLSTTHDTISLTFPDDNTLSSADEFSVAISGVENPNESPRIAVGVQLNPDRDGPRGVASIDIYTPAPSISPQGVIGDSTRIGVHDPRGASGFIVAYDHNGPVIGTHALDLHQNLHMDIGIGAFVDDAHEENGMTVRLVAHNDTNGNGEFDPSVDERYRIDGSPVEATVENAIFEGGRTTTTTTTPPTATTSRMTADGTTVSPTASTTNTTVPGFHVAVILFALLGLATLARRG